MLSSNQTSFWEWLLLLSFLFLVSASSILPTSYPDAFSISFETNVTDENPEGPIYGRLYYDWSIPAQRIDHAAGSFECTHFYNSTEACSLVFLQTGMYRILYPRGDCCLDIPNLGPPPPTWARQKIANPTYDGMVWDDFSQLVAHQWSFDNLTSSSSVHRLAYAYHTIRQVAFGDYAGRPLVFTFPGKANGTQDFHYLPDTMQIGPPPVSLFKLRDDCTDNLCQIMRSPVAEG
jgi:hypothetical protein